MEDAATAEIARAQLWQWAHYGTTTDSGKKVTAQYLDNVLSEEADKVKKNYNPKHVETSRRYMSEQVRRHTTHTPTNFCSVGTLY